MEYSLQSYGKLPVEAQLKAELERCNDLSSRYGLTLSLQQMHELHQGRLTALKDTRRIEFGPGILPKLIEAFCDSPFISQHSYHETLWQLQDSFYYFKQEAMESMADDELISLMASYFNGVCQGSLDYLGGTTLEELCRRSRSGGLPLQAENTLF